VSDPERNAGCLGWVLGFLVGPKRLPLPYAVRDNFVTPAELAFWRVLARVVGGRLVVCPKVRLGDLFFVTRPANRMSHYGRISQKHVDFLLCDPDGLKPVVAIELDDSSHARPDRQERDAFVNQVFEAADLPLLRIPVRRHYAPAELGGLLAPYLESDPAPVPPPIPPKDGPPLCPKCGVPMVVRTAERGKFKGRQFFGCPNYPKCQERRPLH